MNAARRCARSIDAGAALAAPDAQSAAVASCNLDRDKLHRLLQRHRRRWIFRRRYAVTSAQLSRAGAIGRCFARDIAAELAFPAHRPAARFACRRRASPKLDDRRRDRAAISTERPSRNSSSRALSIMPTKTACFASFASFSSTAGPTPATWRSPIAGISGISTPECRDSASQASRRTNLHADIRLRLRAAPCDRAGRHRRADRSRLFHGRLRGNQTRRSLLIFEADNTAIVHDMDPPDLFPYKAPQMRKIFDAFAAMLSTAPARDGSARRDRAIARDIAAVRSRARRSIPKNWDDIRAQGHRMLDDMIDYVANIRDRPVWQPIPDDVRARFHAALPRQRFRSRRRLSGIRRFHRSLCDRQRASGLHGLGAWRRHRGRHAGGNAGGRTECQSRRTRSHADRGRTPDRRMDARRCSAFPRAPAEFSSPARRWRI